MKNSTIDAVKIVREIRDQHYEQTRALSREELYEVYKKRGQQAKRKFEKPAKASQK